MTHIHPTIRVVGAAIFSGEYVTGDITEEYLSHLHDQRNDGALTMKHMRMLNITSRCVHRRRLVVVVAVLVVG